jgi:outer membrane murein-binding lipoprotein Lpp
MRVICAVLAAWLVVGCERQAQTANTPSQPELSLQVEELRQTVSALSAKVTEHRMEALRASMKVPGSAVTFDPRDAAGYSNVASPVGVLLVKLEKVEPYLDGYNLTFLIGNPTAARLSGVSGVVKWGEEIDWNDIKSFERVSEKRFDSPIDFHSGAWTPVKMTIGPAKPAQIRRIIFEPVFNSVYMRAPSASNQ